MLHIVPALFGSQGVTGGAERYVLELARYMANEVPTTLVSFSESEQQERMGSLSIHLLGPPWYVRGQRTNPFSWSLFAEVKKAQIIHCHQQHILASSLSALGGRLLGKRVFVTDLGGGGWDLSGYWNTDRWYHAHLHISEYSRQVFGHAEKPWAYVIYGGVDPEKFSPSPAVKKDGTVLFVGRLLPHKGIDHLIAALTPEMRLEIIGEQRDERYLRDLKELAQGKTIFFRHDCDDTDLIAAYRRASCIVLPSVYTTMYGQHTQVPELLGQTLLEGMACGLPAICTAVASMPEVVEHGITGWVVPPQNPAAIREKLVWFREHPGEAQTMGEEARRHVLEKFHWPVVVRRCLQIYEAYSPK